MLDRAEAIKTALSFLQQARAMFGSNDNPLKLMEEHRNNAGASYADLGTSAEEVARLKGDGNLLAAIQWFNAECRHLDEGGDADFCLMERFRKMAGASYEDIGTTEAEIAAMQVRGHINEAKRWLDNARTLPRNTEVFIQYMEQHRQKAGASYADLETSKEEIAALQLRSA